MKEQSKLQKLSQLPKLGKTRSGSQTNTQKRVHQRGDKVVVNGAKQSLMAILRRYMCDCERHSLEKATSKFLTLNKVSASYDLVVWMFIFMRMNCSMKVYEEIVSEYLMKMNKKRDEDQTHHSAKYIQSKKVTLKKFINSAQSLLNSTISSKEIQNSVSVLYSKGKSKDDAVKKIIDCLSKVNQQFKEHDCLTFKKTECSFSTKSLVSSSNQKIQPLEQTPILNKLNFMIIQNDDHDKSSSSYPQKQDDTLSSPEDEQIPFFYKQSLAEKPAQEPSTMPKDQPNKSYRQNQDNESFDLFDELILDESVDSPNSSNFFYFFN